MKELSIEEKAKRYDEASKEASVAYKDEDRHLKATLERIFPELKESEDEKIRKRIIHCLHGDVLEMSEIKEAIAWLEKQGEKNMIPLDKVIKFLDDQLVNDKDEVTGESFINFKNYGTFKETFISFFKRKMLEKQGIPAKLSEEEQNIFAKGVLTSCAMSFIDYLDAHKYEGKMCVSNGECEDIENAFHNAMWDRLHRYYCKYLEKQGEQKPVESTDLKTWKYIVDAVLTEREGIGQYIDSPWTTEVAEKLQERFGNIEQKPAWSKEDNRILSTLTKYLEEHGGGIDGWECSFLSNWLKSLKDRVQPKQGWSEEEKRYLCDISKELVSLRNKSNSAKSLYMDRLITFISNISGAKYLPSYYCDNCKLKKPQSQWKPSERQIYLLNWVANILLKDDGVVEKETAKELQQLLEQLKKLKE